MRGTINFILDEYKKHLIKNNLSDEKNNISVMLNISQIEKFWSDDILCEYFINMCKKIKYNMENMKWYYPIGMIGGFGQYAFLINEFSKKTGNLLNFNKKVYEYYSDYICNIFKIYMINNKSSYLYYDVVNGASGILYYLVENKNILQDDEVLYCLIDYLSDIKIYNEIVNGDVLINFGMAHGMIGILTSLCKAYSEGYCKENQIKKINEIFEIYEKFQKYKTDILYFPSILSYEEFSTGDFEIKREDRTYTWCYGSITILKALIKSYAYMGNKIKVDYYSDLLEILLSKSISNYKLNVPIICHGYSSVVNIIESSLNKSYFKNKFINNKHVERFFIEKIISEIIQYSDLEDYIIRRFNNDISFLQGFGGVVMTLARYIKNDLSFDKLLLID